MSATSAVNGFEQITTAEKQFEYYSQDDIRIWQPPVDPAKWNKTLAQIGGFCPFGDQRLRLVWGATEETDGYIQTDYGSVPARVRKYPVGGVSKVQILRGYDYFDKHGKHHFVARADLVPKEYMTTPRYEYLHLGVLRWVFERKFTVPELIAAQMRPDPKTTAGKNYGLDVKTGRRYIAPTNPRGEYILLYPLQTPDGGYFEPDARWFEGLRKTQQETELDQAEKSRLLGKTLERFQKEDEAKEKAEREELFTFTEDAIIEAEKESINRVMQKRGHRIRHTGRG